MDGERIYEGVFAVHKPQGVTSADVLRHLQKHFNPSKLFRPWIEDERHRRAQDSNWKRHRKRHKPIEVKIGHGGTLDPMATGVLIAGVGKGTKDLQNFLNCTKTYETVVLFGAETDTYDRLGRIVRRAPYEHVTRDVVEKALEQFRGKIMQRPPIFSALRVQGKKLYEYAREGKEPPVEIKSRPVEVHDLRILEWYEPGTHEWKWPEQEVAADEKEVAEKMLEKDASVPLASAEEAQLAEESSLKRKSPPPPAEEEGEGKDAPPSTKRLKATDEGEPTPAGTHEPTTTTEEGTEESPDKKQPAGNPPAVKLTLTVSSGFYVRSLAHDLGKAVGSCGLMSALVRSRQGEFELSPDKVLEYEDLERGEEFWGPKNVELIFFKSFPENKKKNSTLSI
ncbi:Pseudouridylate synthase [Rasamsonia emersonii CBS 393.64]|uniref:tRNA pseudouridine(55) synthase n=1 Tax=Rasamsonia emersonii (strain ATCC 16479 / CBS 393.64 / IMI 116815) TaxID=1408163 RepID=A0A0F4YM07_RASE3|nr:Pseudouridylate synthase [Rasamsonia emersonii CBS 393.64]KKA18638.1 Pseudouridylate synthase [Rasamsonia emersonii CBS 393.64]